MTDTITAPEGLAFVVAVEGGCAHLIRAAAVATGAPLRALCQACLAPGLHRVREVPRRVRPCTNCLGHLRRRDSVLSSRATRLGNRGA